MNTLTKQELQIELQQMTNLLLAKTASHQDILAAIQNLSRSLCAKQDVQTMLDHNKDRITERLLASLQEELSLLRYISGAVESINSRLVEIENRQDEIYNDIKESANEVATLARQNVAKPASPPVTGTIYR